MYKPKPGKSFADTQPDMIKEWSDKNESKPSEDLINSLTDLLSML